MGCHRWEVERSLGWLHKMKRLRVNEERSAGTHLALLRLGCCRILYRELERHLRDGALNRQGMSPVLSGPFFWNEF